VPKNAERLVAAAPHLAALRSNGNPYLLYLLKIGGVPSCVFVDKKVQQGYFFPRMVLCHLRFAERLFEDTLVDGEMTKLSGDAGWRFLVHDVLAYAGRPTAGMALPARLAFAAHLLEHDCDRAGPTAMFHMCLKRHVPLAQVQALLDDVPRLPYSCRGVYVRAALPGREPDMLHNFDESLVRRVAKPAKAGGAFNLLPEDAAAPEAAPPAAPAAARRAAPDDAPARCTRQLWLQRTELPDVYELYQAPAGERGGEQHFDTACVPSLSLSERLRDCFAGRRPNERVRMQCAFSDDFKRWVPDPPPAHPPPPA
jgi:hypothetical protein